MSNNDYSKLLEFSTLTFGTPIAGALKAEFPHREKEYPRSVNLHFPTLEAE
jgi:hypothetical protein